MKLNEFITVQEALDCVAWIKEHKDDDEVAYSVEDDLMEAVLRTTQELAKISLSTAGIKFSRWCA